MISGSALSTVCCAYGRGAILPPGVPFSMYSAYFTLLSMVGLLPFGIGRQLRASVPVLHAGGSPGAEAVYLPPVGFLYVLPLRCPRMTSSSAFRKALDARNALDGSSVCTCEIAFFTGSLTLILKPMVCHRALRNSRWYPRQALPCCGRPEHGSCAFLCHLLPKRTHPAPLQPERRAG